MNRMALFLLKKRNNYNEKRINMNISDNHAQAILDIFAVAVSDLVALGLSEDDAISGLLGQASVRVDKPAMSLAIELHRLYHKDFSIAKN